MVQFILNVDKQCGSNLPSLGEAEHKKDLCFAEYMSKKQSLNDVLLIFILAPRNIGKII